MAIVIVIVIVLAIAMVIVIIIKLALLVLDGPRHLRRRDQGLSIRPFGQDEVGRSNARAIVFR